MNARGHGDLGLYLRLLKEARRYWLHLAVIQGLSLLSTPLALLSPLPMTIIVDSVIGSQPLPASLGAILPQGLGSGAGLLAAMAILLVLLALVNQGRELIVSQMKVNIGEGLVLDFRGRLFRHLQRLSLAHHDAHGTSDSVYRIQQDAQAIQNVAIE